MSKHHRFRLSFSEHLEPRVMLAADLGDVLFLGDSITQGNANTNSYRYALWQDFIDAGIEFNLVGSQNSFYNSPRVLPDYMGHPFPNIHEGHWGWAAESIVNGKPTTMPEEGKLSDWVQGYDADTVLIHLGTNDLKQDKLAETVDYMEQIVGVLQADNPNVTIIVAQIIPYYKGEPNHPNFTAEELAAINDRIVQFNSILASDAPGWSTASSRVSVVNQYEDPNSPGDPLPLSYYFTNDYVHLDNDEGAPLMAARWFDGINAIAPTIVGVRVGSTSWEQAFVNSIDPELMLGYEIPNGPAQTNALPWSNIDQIHLTFEEAVTIDESNISLTGEFHGPYELLSGSVVFDASVNTATISLPTEVSRDRLTLTVFETVVDLTGNALDGNWTDGQTLFRSGDGTAGDDFVFSINVLPGDINQSLFVDGNDVRAARNTRFETVGSEDYSFLVDVNGDGIISGPDISFIRNRRFTDLLPPAQAVDGAFAEFPGLRIGQSVGKLSIDDVFAEKELQSKIRLVLAKRSSAFFA